MGYSLSVRFKSQAERDHMLAFLNAQDWGALHATAPFDPAIGPVPGESLGYAPGGKMDNVLGFNGSSLPFYAWSVGAWAATKSTFRSRGEIVIYYDGDRMLVEQDPPAGQPPLPPSQRTRVDQRGIVIPSQNTNFVSQAISRALGLDDGQAAQHAWLVALDNAWTAHVTPAPKTPRASP